MMVQYFELLDNENKGTIVKSYGQKKYMLIDGEWVRTGILTDYLMADIYDESPKSPNDYIEISEEEALKKLGINN
ncbi:hypothetical protein [Allofustis seminis]|uniref:hypothetical protein n=1 Tax=Allofustis seminis TaxID=166939 RepID=UPI0012E9E307|nr:hypothetical protein [Allofustis seminis]